MLLHCLVEPNGSGEVPSVSWFRGSGELQLLTCEYSRLPPNGSPPFSKAANPNLRLLPTRIQTNSDEQSTIIQDERFVVRLGIQRDNDWALQIKNLDKSSDAGLYQCQTGSDSPQSQFYQLNIVGECLSSSAGASQLELRHSSATNHSQTATTTPPAHTHTQSPK